MIDLTWVFEKDTRMNAIVIAEFMVWLLKVLNEEDNQDIIINGTMIFRDCEAPLKYSLLLMCEEKKQKKLLQILQQPPGEFSGKYVACIFTKEPEPVVENHNDDEAEEMVMENT